MFRLALSILLGVLLICGNAPASANEAMKEHLAKHEAAEKAEKPKASRSRGKGAIRLTSPYGMRHLFGITRLHKGIDIGAPIGTPVRPMMAGIVIRSGWVNGYGKMIEIFHGSGITTRYAHLDQILVRPGLYVRKGECIGLTGNTGRSTGPHLHFEIRHKGDPVDPLLLARKKRVAEALKSQADGGK